MNGLERDRLIQRHRNIVFAQMAGKGSEEIQSRRKDLLLERHMITAKMVQNRLNAKDPLSAQEMLEGVRLPHDEYVELIKILSECKQEIHDLKSQASKRLEKVE